MRKLLTAVMSLVFLAGAAAPTLAQKRQPARYDGRAAQQRSYEAQRRAEYNQRYDDRTVWEKHRDKLTVAGGTVAGAAVGGMAGGKKGALIGAIVGAGGSAVYTYKIRERDEYRRY